MLDQFSLQLLLKTGRMSSTSQKLCLNWKNFQQNISTAFRELRSDSDFSDVTLACEDGHKFSAHKVILASSSPFFMNILKMYKNPHPLIFMRGVKSEELSALVDFLYYGEANIEQENLESFLTVAEDLKILGLTRTEGMATKSKEISSGKGNGPVVKVKAEDDIEIEDNGPEEDGEIQNNVPGSLLETSTAPASAEDNLTDAGSPQQLDTFADEDNIKTKVMSMMKFSENKVMSNKKPGTTLGRARICKVCGKEGTYGTVWNHIEAKHLENSYSCFHCGKISKSRNGLAQHRAKDHTK